MYAGAPVIACNSGGPRESIKHEVYTSRAGGRVLELFPLCLIAVSWILYGGGAESCAKVTGFLCEPQAEEFAEAMALLADDPNRVRKMGEAGHLHAEERYSLTSFTQQLEAALRSMLS